MSPFHAVFFPVTAMILPVKKIYNGNTKECIKGGPDDARIQACLIKQGVSLMNEVE